MTAETFLNGRVVLHCGDSREVLKGIPDNSIDSIVTDPPYALVSIVKRFGAGGAPVKVPEGGSGVYARASAGFMGKTWDTGETAFAAEFWAECLRVLKPGGHVVAFSGTRTVHRMACAIEDAGFEIRDSILEMVDSAKPGSAFLESLNDEQRVAFVRLMDDATFTGMLGWAYGSGFPKSHDVSKGIDKALGGEREMVAPRSVIAHQRSVGNVRPWMLDPDHKTVSDEPATDDAAKWQGWGTALKPAWEPIVLARKPLAATVARNVLEFGTGAINIDSCRVGSESRSRSTGEKISENLSMGGGNYSREVVGTVEGRWPANILHDGSDEVVDAFPDSTSGSMKVGTQRAAQDEPGSVCYGTFGGNTTSKPIEASAGSASRFFYTAKADAGDRIGSKHPTVKPVDLMQWLCRLVTPPGGTVLDPFAGSGTTGEAAFREGFNAVLVEREVEYQADIRRRMALCMSGPEERKRESIKAKHGDIPFDKGSLFADLNAPADPSTPPHDGADRSTASSRTNDRANRIETLVATEQP